MAGAAFLQRLLLLSTAATSLGEVPSKEACGGVDPLAWTSPTLKQKGYHALCITNPADACRSSSDAAEGECKAAGAPTATVCWGGSRSDCTQLPGVDEVLASAGGRQGLYELQEKLIAAKPLANPTRFNKLIKAREKQNKLPLNFAFFSVKGDGAAPAPLTSIEDASGMILAFEGGSFIWPGVEPGFERNVTIQPRNSEPLEVKIITRAMRPLVVEISSFLGDAECDHIIQKAEPHIKKSSVSHMDHDVGKPDTNWRTSSTYFMPSDDNILRTLDDRVSALTLLKKSHQEHAQILRYEKGERYVAHHDYFDPSSYANNPDILSLTKKGMFNRLATVFFYLSDVESGGQTNFPRTDGRPQPHDFGDCSKGVSVDPTRGRIIIFYSQHPSAEMDELSLHGGCAVEEGTKWSANKWIWNKPMGFTSD
eukprot:TRINITY_DN47535_c0_g1_i1.p1 TRINITY_DN47535_c0_g1~~TRINITY_DN47535_c0_g1_i1.p1  ORF type:complete len:424 (-),score=69.73 TRINITY_DN47535_c0_g1_i1:21-1292(-)